MADAKTHNSRREHLIDAARRAMIEHGSAVRLNQVAEQAGLTSGAVLYHYPDLQNLLLEAHQAGMERFYEKRIQTLELLDDPVEKLITTISGGLPRDADDPDVRLLNELGGSAGRNRVYGALLTTLFDRQVTMYQEILLEGVGAGLFKLTDSSRTISRNIVALEDAYGYRIVARHPSIHLDQAIELILSYARSVTGHPLPRVAQQTPATTE